MTASIPGAGFAIGLSERLVAEDLAQALRERWPQARITILAPRQDLAAALAAAGPLDGIFLSRRLARAGAEVLRTQTAPVVVVDAAPPEQAGALHLAEPFTTASVASLLRRLLPLA